VCAHAVGLDVARASRRRRRVRLSSVRPADRLVGDGWLRSRVTRGRDVGADVVCGIRTYGGPVILRLYKLDSSYIMVNASPMSILIKLFSFHFHVWKSGKGMDEKREPEHAKRDPALWCVLSSLASFLFSLRPNRRCVIQKNPEGLTAFVFSSMGGWTEDGEDFAAL
jgi:hypothetical protein